MTPSQPLSGSGHIGVVEEFCANVLRHGRDVYGDDRTPMLADGVNVRTREPVRWRWSGGVEAFGPPGEWIVSNLAQQQNLFRTLAGLSALTGDETYRRAAVDATRYHLETYQGPYGLLRWGGHQFVDLLTKQPQGPAFTNCHEFKTTYPFYSFLWEVDPAAARRSLEGVWNAHVLDWGTLDMNRHGMYEQPRGKLWDSEFADPPSFFTGTGLTFVNAGSDLVYAAAHLAHATGEPGPLRWAKRLARSYVKARDPETGLGAYQYSQPAKVAEAPSDRDTKSMYGDRARNQLGPELGDRALEGKVLLPRHAQVIYGNASIVSMQMAELLGEPGRELLDWTHEGLVAYARHGFGPGMSTVRPLLTDGTDLSGYELRRDGYYGDRGTRLQPAPAGLLLFWSYLLGARLTGDGRLWDVARGIGRAAGLGDIGTAPGVAVAVDAGTAVSDPLAVFGLLEAVRTAPDPAYLELARAVADNIVGQRFHGGFFVPSARHVNARFDAIEPLALVSLQAAMQGRVDDVSPYNAGMGYLHGYTDPATRTRDSDHLYGATA